MVVIENDFIPFKGYKCINLFGVMFVRRGVCLTDSDIRHEAVHTEQMKRLWYVGFYVQYVAEFIYYLLEYRDWRKAYRSVSFEREAYAGN